jgi:Arc/MetJ family transcription regulator
MKITMQVDDTLLERVMKVTGADNKTRAVDIALRELYRRHKLMRLAEVGLGFSADDLRKACDSASL